MSVICSYSEYNLYNKANLYVQISHTDLVLFNLDDPADDFTPGKVVLPPQEEAGLPPVSLRAEGAGGEGDGQVTLTELHVEIGSKALGIIRYQYLEKCFNLSS